MSDTVLPEVTPPVALNITPSPAAEAPAATPTPAPADASATPETHRKRGRPTGREQTDFPNWIPTKYRKDKDTPFTSVAVHIDQAAGVLTFTCTDANGTSTSKVRVTSITNA